MKSFGATRAVGTARKHSLGNTISCSITPKQHGTSSMFSITSHGSESDTTTMPTIQSTSTKNSRCGITRQSAATYGTTYLSLELTTGSVSDTQHKSQKRCLNASSKPPQTKAI